MITNDEYTSLHSADQLLYLLALREKGDNEGYARGVNKFLLPPGLSYEQQMQLLREGRVYLLEDDEGKLVIFTKDKGQPAEFKPSEFKRLRIDRITQDSMRIRTTISAFKDVGLMEEGKS